MSIPITIATSEKTIETLVLIDDGAGGKFIDQNFAKNFTIQKLNEPMKVFNVDGTKNTRGTIKHYVDLEITIGKRKLNERLLVTGLGKQKIILGFPWLREQKPLINWRTGKIEWEK